MPPVKMATKAPADGAADAALGALIAAREAEHLSFVAASAQVSAMFRAASDPDRKRQYAAEVAKFEADMAAIEAAILDMKKIAGKANSGAKLAKAHDDSVAECAAWIAANPVASQGTVGE